jgi:hypothetical protein
VPTLIANACFLPHHLLRREGAGRGAAGTGATGTGEQAPDTL